MFERGELVEFHGTRGYYQGKQGGQARVLVELLVPIKDVKDVKKVKDTK